MPRQNYKVVFNITKQIAYVVDANSPEEAEIVAEDYMADGEAPVEEELLDASIEEVFPADEQESA